MKSKHNYSHGAGCETKWWSWYRFIYVFLRIGISLNCLSVSHWRLEIHFAVKSSLTLPLSLSSSTVLFRSLFLPFLHSLVSSLIWDLLRRRPRKAFHTFSLSKSSPEAWRCYRRYDGWKFIFFFVSLKCFIVAAIYLMTENDAGSSNSWKRFVVNEDSRYFNELSFALSGQ